MPDNANESASNIVNLGKITEFFDSVSAHSNDSKKIKEYLSLALEKAFRKDSRYLRRLEELPDNPPDWLRQQWGQKTFHVFEPDDDLRQKVEHIKDWIQASIQREAPWLSHVDQQGRPLKLLKIATLEQALKEAEKDGRQQRQKHKSVIDINSAFLTELNEGDISIVMVFEDGYKIVQILNKIGAARESYLMQHCLADGGYDDVLGVSGDYGSDSNQSYNPHDIVIYSLRDPENQPHVTMEVNKESKLIYQCKGKQNRTPVEKYLPYISDFIKRRKLGLYDMAFPGCVFKDGVLYKIEELPDDFEVIGKLDIRNVPDFKCPRNLRIKGTLYLDALQRPFLKPCLEVTGFIEEHVQIDGSCYQNIRHKNRLGRLYSVTWHHSFYGFHREGAPAIIDYNSLTGQIISEKWYSKGKLHNTEGPALQSWDSITGEVIAQSWYLNGSKINPPAKQESA